MSKYGRPSTVIVSAASAAGVRFHCICGGAESKVNPMGLIRQSLLGRLATDSNDKPVEACKPFDAARSGTVVSEGGGLLILENLERAEKRGARIYGEMIGRLRAAHTRRVRIRLLGVKASRLSEDQCQLDMFEVEKQLKQLRLNAAFDTIRRRHGTKAVRRARSLKVDVTEAS